MITTTPPSSESPSPSGPEGADLASSTQPATVRSVSFRRPRALWWGMALAVLVALVAAAIVYYLTSPVRVDLSVDGQTQSIDTRADSVADLLVAQDVTISNADSVTPPVDSELAEGDTIVVRFARPLAVVVDGSETVYSTTELTVGDALEEVSAPIEGAAVSLSLTEALPRSGATVEIFTPKSVTLDVGGEARPVTSTAESVGDLLENEGIVLAETDRLTPSADTAVADAMSITVTRIRVETETRTEPIAHESTEQSDPDLTVGTRRVATDGADGTQDVTYSVTYTNDEITSEETVSTTVTQEPVTEVITVGTKPAPPKPAAASGSSSGLNWGALAQCESSGNPRAVNPAGYYGLYQFSLPTWASVGGTGNPADASPAEQTTRAQILYERSGVGQWPHCGPRLYD